MSEFEKKDAVERLASVLEAGQFIQGSLDVTLQGPDRNGFASPLRVVLYLQGEEVQNISGELGNIATALSEIAEAIRGVKG